jgi:hypothetical protein
VTPNENDTEIGIHGERVTAESHLEKLEQEVSDWKRRSVIFSALSFTAGMFLSVGIIVVA